MKKIGYKIHKLAKKLWPINRSITGNGLRKSLLILKAIIPSLKIYEVKTGTKIFDWKIPLEWNVKEAWIKDSLGKKIIDFKKNNLHLVSYSTPQNKKISLKELKKNLHTIETLPNAIPYVTSYYKKNWGFCIDYKKYQKLKKDIFHVFIDSELKKGSMSYGEILIKGQSKKEIFLSTYLCHPSMANNELSGPTVLIFIAKWLLSLKNNYYSYRIIFIPETIGSLTYINKNLKKLKKNIIAGFNITCIGDERGYSLIPSRNNNTIADQISRHVLKWIDKEYIEYTWLDRGSDERQYCSPGIDLPVSTLMKSKFDKYKEYHTSLDDLKTVVTVKGLDDGYNLIKKVILSLEKNFYYKTIILGEPHFSKYGLYPNISNKNSAIRNQGYKFLRNILTYCDGNHSLLEIADKINVPIWELYDPIDNFVKIKMVSKLKKSINR